MLSVEELYCNAYNMVLHKNGEKLYSGVKELITQHLEEVALKEVAPAFPVSETSIVSRRAASGGNGANFLKVLKRVWEDHTYCMMMIRDVLMYMVSV